MSDKSGATTILIRPRPGDGVRVPPRAEDLAAMMRKAERAGLKAGDLMEVQLRTKNGTVTIYRGPVVTRIGRSSFPPWAFFVPAGMREALFREWLDERDSHRAEGRSSFYIWSTLFSQVFVIFVISCKDFLLELVARAFRGPGAPGAA